MSLYQKASLVQIPSGYKAADDKLYSVVPSNGDGDFTVSVDADATRVNKDGLIESVAADQARLNYNFIDGVVQPDPHLLLEPTRTNQILYSEDFTNAVWQKISGGTGVAPVVTANYSVAPDGSNTADRVVLDMGSNTSINDYSIIRNFGTSGSTGTNSVYIKSNTSDSYTLGIDNTGQQETITVTPQWQRFSYSVTNSDRLQISLRGGGQTVSGYADVSMWGGSLENGTYVTSYIPTTTGAVTRALDNAHLLNQTLFTNYPFTVYAKASLDAIGNTIFSLNNTSSQNYYLAVYFPNSTQVGLLRRDLSINDSDFYSFSGSVGTTYKIAVTFVSATAYKLYIDGTQIANITSGGSIPFNHNDISLGQFRITGDTATRNGIDEFMVFNEALSDSELQTLTS